MPEFLEPLWIMAQVFGGLAFFGWMILKFIKALMAMEPTDEPLNPPKPIKPIVDPLEDWRRN